VRSDGETGSDGSTPQDRANAAGYRGRVNETVAINPALAINNLDILHQWYYDPVTYAVMADCAKHADRRVVREQPEPKRGGGRLRSARTELMRCPGRCDLPQESRTQ